MFKKYFCDLIESDLNQFSKKTLFLYYFFFIIFVSILSTVYCKLYLNNFPLVDKNYNIIFEKIPFDYGKLCANLFYESKYSFEYENIEYYLRRLPVLPLLIVFLAKISKNIFFIFIFKNIILYSILFFISFFSLKTLDKKKYFFFIILILFFINPYNNHVGLTFVFADSLLVILLPCLFLSLLSKSNQKYYVISILLFFLYLTKTTLFFITIFLPVLIIILENNKLKNKFFPILGTLLAILAWGSYGFYKTGKFPFGSSQLTTNSKSLHEVVLNENFKDYYPLKSVDLIPKEYTPSHLKTEWDIHEYYKFKNSEYMKKNFSKFLMDIPIKLKFIFFNIFKDSVHANNEKFENPILISHLINKFFFNIAVFLSLYILIKNCRSIKELYNYKMEIYFLFICALNLAPHIIGWSTSKHLVPIQIISSIYFIFKIDYYLLKK